MCVCVFVCVCVCVGVGVGVGLCIQLTNICMVMCFYYFFFAMISSLQASIVLLYNLSIRVRENTIESSIVIFQLKYLSR